jgi:hypothetical protein
MATRCSRGFNFQNGFISEREIVARASRLSHISARQCHFSWSDGAQNRKKLQFFCVRETAGNRAHSPPAAAVQVGPFDFSGRPSSSARSPRFNAA